MKIHPGATLAHKALDLPRVGFTSQLRRWPALGVWEALGAHLSFLISEAEATGLAL